MPQAAPQSNNAPPPLPPGYTLDSDNSGLPPGYTLDEPKKVATPEKEGALSRFNDSLSTGLGAKPGFVDTLKDMGSGLKQMATHPIDSAGLLLHGAADAQQEVIDKAYQEQQSPDLGTRAKGYVRGAYSAIPLVGPLLSKGSDEFSSGNVAGGSGTMASVFAPAAIGKFGPSAFDAARPMVNSAAKTVGASMGVGLTPEQLLTKGISPRASQLGFKEALPKALQDLRAYDQEVAPIKSVSDLNDAIPEMQKKIWSTEVEPALKRQASKPVNMEPTAQAVRHQVSPEMEEFDAGAAKDLNGLADKLGKARDVESANRLLKYVNGKLDSYFAKYPSAQRSDLLNNPETAGWEAARRSLRGQFLDTLEQAGEEGVRDARQRYGALSDIGDEVERRVNVADRQKPMTFTRIMSLLSGMGIAGEAISSGHPLGALVGLAPPVFGEVATRAMTPDALVRRGIGKIPYSPRTPFEPPSAEPLQGNPSPFAPAVPKFTSASKANLAQRSPAMDVPEWVQGQRSGEVRRLTDILRNPNASPEERQYAERFLKDLQP